MGWGLVPTPSAASVSPKIELLFTLPTKQLRSPLLPLSALIRTAWAATSRTPVILILLGAISSIPVLLLWWSAVWLGPGPGLGLGPGVGATPRLAARLSVLAVTGLAARLAVVALAARTATAVSGPWSGPTATVSWSGPCPSATLTGPWSGVTERKTQGSFYNQPSTIPMQSFLSTPLCNHNYVAVKVSTSGINNRYIRLYIILFTSSNNRQLALYHLFTSQLEQFNLYH